jgi:hypothetical protein
MLRRAPLALVLVACGVVLAFLAALLASTEGHFVPQVVDLYLVCQYARAMAEGHPFRYNAGDEPSTGATSLLHTAMLAGAHAAGARGEALVAVAILQGAACLVASVLLARRIAVRLAGEREGLLAGALVALGGPVAWGFLYGADTAPAMLLTLGLLDALLTAWSSGRCGGVACFGSLLALTRPEGLPMALAVALGLLGRRERPGSRGQAALALAPVAAGVAVLALNWTLTGRWLGSSVADKSLVASYGLRDGLALSAEYLVDVARGLLLGLYPSLAPVGFGRGWAAVYFPPLGLLLVLLALARVAEEHRPVLRLWLGVCGVAVLLAAPSVFMGVHYNRYLLPVLPSLLALVAVGLGCGARLAARGAEGEAALFHAGAGLFLALGVLSTLRFATLYGEGAGEVYRRDVKAAEWIRGNLPRGVRIANVATSIEYLTGHHALNLHGVTSPAFFGNRTAEREAGTFEALGRLPPSERPEYLISSVSAQQANASLRALVEEPALFQTSSLGDEILVFRMRWELVGKNARPFLPETLALAAGLREVDRLNVCDTRDEEAHAYSCRSRVGDVALHGAVRVDAYRGAAPEPLADGGRVVLGSESFVVRGTAAGRDLVVVLRTAPAHDAGVFRTVGRALQPFELPELGIRLFAGEREAGAWSARPREGWEEVVLRVPGPLVTAPTTRLTLRGRYASFYFWFYQ